LVSLEERIQTGTTRPSSSEATTRREFRCGGCGFGAIASGPPPTCPICRNANWNQIEPGSRRNVSDQQVNENVLTVKRLSESAYLVTPPSTLDIPAGTALAEAIAELAHEQPDIVLDLTHVVEVDPEAARLLLRLGALAHTAGGRLLAACPCCDADGFAFHPLAPEPPATDQIEGALGRALRQIERADRRRKAEEASTEGLR
jgi:hypothetical protein